MTYVLKEIQPSLFKQALEKASQKTTFLQSLAYYEFRKSQGETLFLMGFYKDSQLLGVTVIQKIKTRIKTFSHIPHGPVWIEVPTEKHWNEFLLSYKNFGQSIHLDFVRIAPQCTNENLPVFKQSGYRDAAIHLVNPEKTWLLDLTKTEDELLAAMKKSTRYEVKKGAKDETQLVVKKGNTTADLDIFWNLHTETVKRQGFVPFSRKATEKELQIFGEECQIISILHDEKPLASGVFIFDKKSGYYHQGASVNSKLPAAHAYIWQAILEAKSRGCETFNFWGVCDIKDTKHPWFGLSKFKRGFGGYEVNYLHVQDAPLKTKYWLTYALEKYRKFKRGY